LFIPDIKFTAQETGREAPCKMGNKKDPGIAPASTLGAVIVI